ncbi:MAG: T9SS type A sorting domain-containing protein [Flavobacteriales bacterium]
MDNQNSNSYTKNSKNDIELNVYPNPTRGKFRLILNNKNLNKIEIINSIGKVVYKKKQLDKNTKKMRIDLSNNQNGIYLIKGSVNGKIITKNLLLLK